MVKEEYKNNEILKSIIEYKLPRWNELPSIDLYIDQIINYVTNIFTVYNEDKTFLTKAMINNYVKQRVLMPPEKKKYTREHLANIIFICILKQIFSLSEIKKFLIMQKKYTVERAYDYFCNEFEKAINVVFDTQSKYNYVESNEEIEKDLVISMLYAVSNKLYVEAMTSIMFKEDDEVKLENDLNEETKKEKKKTKKNDKNIKSTSKITKAKNKK